LIEDAVRFDRDLCWIVQLHGRVGEHWLDDVRGFVTSVLADAADAGCREVDIDVYELGESTRQLLAKIGFAPRGPRDRVWRARVRD